MHLLYGLDLPLLVILTVIWLFIISLAEQSVYSQTRKQLINRIQNIQRLYVFSLLPTFLLLIMIWKDLGWYLDHQLNWLYRLLLIIPITIVYMLSHPRLNQITQQITEQGESKIELLQLIHYANLWIHLPLQAAAFSSMLNVYFLVVPFVPLQWEDIVLPFMAMLLFMIGMGFRYQYRLKKWRQPNDIWRQGFFVRLTHITISLGITMISILVPILLGVLIHPNTTLQENSPKQHPIKTGTIPIEGAELYYEIRGQGPPLIMISGGGGDAGFYTYVANLLADQYQVITYDRRGNSRSKHQKTQSLSIRQQARDAAHVLRAAGHRSAFVFGNSAGAIIALEMATNHPETIQSVIVHEPPIIQVLPEREKWLSFFTSVHHVAYRLNPETANTLFTFSLAVPFSAMSSVPEDFSIRNQNNQAFLITDEMISFVNYQPNIAKLKKNKVNIMVAAGQMTIDKQTYYSKPAAILAKTLGTPFVTFPGHHLSYFDLPKAWAERLDQVIQQSGKTE